MIAMSQRHQYRFACLALAAMITATGCDDDDEPERFQVTLTGAAGVTTDASGSATFTVHDDNTVSFAVRSQSLRNFTMTHIHLGLPGTAGPIAVWLRPTAPPPLNPPEAGPINGVLAQGTISAANFQGSLAGQNIEALLRILRKDSAYVNVHTTQVPAGEIRGQF
jgi:hypothetical protein